MTDGATGIVSIVVAGQEYDIQLEEGKGNYTISGLSARPYTVTAYCRGDENYLISNSSAHFTVNKKNTPIDVVVTNATVGSIEFITVTVDTNASGNILLNINGSTYYSVIEKGVAKFNVTGLLVGNYTAVVTYEGDDCFNTNTTNASIKTEKITTLINITPVGPITAGELITFIIETSENITDLITIEIGEENYQTFIVNGNGTLTVVILENGTYTAAVYYAGDDEYYAAQNSTDFVVNAKLPTEINITVQNITVGDDLTVYVNVTDGATGWLYIVIAGTAYNVELNDSKANITVSNLIPRDYQVTVYYFGDENYLANESSADFTVLKKNSTITANATNVTVGDSVTISVNITEGTTGVVLFDINGNDYYINLTNNQPQLVLNNLPVGNYTVNVIYLGDDNYTSSRTTTKFNVTKVVPDFAIILTDGHDYPFGDNVVVKVTGPEDFTGVAIVYVNSTSGEVVNYTVYINNGEGYLTITKPVVGRYNVTATYQENFKYTSKESNMVGFEVYMNGTELSVNAHNIKVDENETIDIIIGNGEFTGEVTIIFDDNGTEFKAPVSYDAVNNISSAQLNISGFTSGIHYVKAFYVENTVGGRTIVHEGYNEFLVEKIESALTIDEIESILVGENVTIKLNISPEDATGTISLYVNGILYPVDMDNLTVIIPGLGADHYNVQAFYSGNDKYLESNATGSFDVTKNNVTLILGVSSITFGDDELINVTVAPDAKGYVLIKIDDTQYYAEIVDGVARLIIPDMIPGDYNVTATFIGDDKYYGNSTNGSFVLSKIKPTIEINGETIIAGHDEVLNITASDNLTVVIKIEFEGQNYTSFISNGKGNFSISGLANGTYTVKVFFEGNAIYDAANDTTTFVVNGKSETELIINVSNITVDDPLSVVVNVTEGATGNVTIVIAGNTYTEPIVGNQATFTINNLTARDYHITAYYFGDDNYLYANASSGFTVNKKNASLIISVTNATVGSTEYINVTLPDGAKGYVLINIEGSQYYAAVIDNVAKFNVTGLLVGNHTAYVTYVGDDIYNATADKANITTAQLTTTISIEATTPIYVGQIERLTIETSENITALVTVVIDGNRTFTTFITEGKGSLVVVNLTKGTHNATVYYAGDDEYAPVNDTAVFEVLDKKPVNVTVEAESVDIGTNATIFVTVVDAETGDNVTGTVTVAIAGKLYEITLENGAGNVSVGNLTARDYHVTAHYGGNRVYFAGDNFADFTVRKLETPIDFNVSTIKVGQDEIINITLPEKASGDLIITVGNISYYKSTEGGNTSITISGLGNGTYDVTVEYKGNDVYANNTAAKQFAVIKNTPEIISIELVDGTVKVTLTDDVTGDVNITVGNITDVVPVVRGTATLDVSGLLPGDYRVNATYMGDDKYDSVNGSEMVNVAKIEDYDVIVNVDNITVGQNATIEVILPENATGFVNITVDGNTTEVPIVIGC